MYRRVCMCVCVLQPLIGPETDGQNLSRKTDSKKSSKNYPVRLDIINADNHLWPQTNFSPPTKQIKSNSNIS